MRKNCNKSRSAEVGTHLWKEQSESRFQGAVCESLFLFPLLFKQTTIHVSNEMRALPSPRSPFLSISLSLSLSFSPRGAWSFSFQSSGDGSAV